jgi:chemotaxis response regulator CheB
VVGIGASAGGLEALRAFFGAVPATTGLAFVIVVHLDPSHDSLMPDPVMAQTPDTASHPGMPMSAIATGLVDVVLRHVRAAGSDRARRWRGAP